MINICKYTEEESSFKETIKLRLGDLNELGFTEKNKGLFVLDDYSINIYSLANKSVDDWLDYIERVKASIKLNARFSNNDKIHKIIRTCFNCKLNTVCFAFKELKETLKYLPSNIDTDEAPMKQVDVFIALAGCCYVYEENN